MKGNCAKQQVFAIIKNNGRLWIGENWCANPQEVCPRGDMPTGEGYEMCTDICGQKVHAEIDVCIKAGYGARGGTLYLIGHTYCCDDCKEYMKQAGVESVRIL